MDGGDGDWMVKIPLLGRKGMVLILVQIVVAQGVTFVLFKPRIHYFFCFYFTDSFTLFYFD